MRLGIILVVMGMAAAVAPYGVLRAETSQVLGNPAAVPHAPVLTAVAISTEQAASADDVEPISGRLTVRVTDLAVPAGPLVLAAERTLRWQPGMPGLLGSQWRLNWERRLIRGGPLAMIEEGEDDLIFTQDPVSGRFRALSGDTLDFEQGVAVRNRPDGVRERYDLGGRLLEEDHGNGVRISVLYSADGHLAAVTGPYDSRLNFTVVNGRLAAVVLGETKTRADYAYDRQPIPGDLQNRAVVFGYGYDAVGRLQTISQSRAPEMTCAFDDASGRVKSRRWSDGRHEEFVWDDASGTVRHTDMSGETTTYSRSKDGRRIDVADALGHKTIIESDEMGRPSKVTGPTGQSVSVKYDGLGRVEAVVDPAGHATRFEYVGATRLPATQDTKDMPRRTFRYSPAGYLSEIRIADKPVLAMTYYPDGLLKSVKGSETPEQRYAYNPAGRLETIADDLGKTVLTYDPQGNLHELTDAAGGIATWNYENGRLKSASTGGNRWTFFEYDEQGRLKSVKDPGDGVSTFDYDAKGRLWHFTDPTLLTQEYEYDADGRLHQTRFSDKRVETYEYQGSRLASVTHSSGAAWKFAYDDAGRLIAEEGPLGHKMGFAYDNADRVLATTDALGRKTAYTYDDLGRLRTVTDPTNRTSTLEYGPDGQLKGVEDSLKRRITLVYDDYGRVTKLSRNTGDLLNLEYRDGQLAKVTGPAGGSVLYTQDGNFTTRRYANGEAATHFHDAVGRLNAVTDALNRTTKLTYAPDQLETTITLPRDAQPTTTTGGTYTYRYTALGQLAWIEDPRHHRRTFADDKLGRRTTETDPLLRETKISYGPEGRVDSVTLPDGKAGTTVERKYDLLGRLAVVQVPQVPDEPPTTFDYDAVGNLKVEKHGQYATTYTYDDLDRLTDAVYQPANKTLHYTYDDAGRRKSMEVVGIGLWTYGYDDRDRLEVLKDPQGRVTRFDYDDAGRVTGQTLPNGVIVKRSYDGRGRLKTLSAHGPGDKIVLDRACEYDLAGNLVKETREGGTTLAYAYDAADRLVQVTGAGDPEKIAYDEVGNITLPDKKTEYDKADQVERFDGQVFQFDFQGRMSTRERGGPKTQYIYDTVGHLVKVTRDQKVVAEYGYDAQGRRVWKSVGGKITHYVYDGLQPVLELDGNLNATRIWTQGPELDRPIGFVQGEAAHYPLADAVGSVVALTGADGAITATRDYHPFGTPRGAAKQLGTECPTGFAGREYDAETGLYYFRARYYDPVLGRFTTPDPLAGDIAEPSTLNNYQYALDNPLRFRDPLGAAPADIADWIENKTSGWGRTVGEGLGKAATLAVSLPVRMAYWASGNTRGTERLNQFTETFSRQTAGKIGDKAAIMATGLVSEPLRFGQATGDLYWDNQAGRHVGGWEIAGAVVQETLRGAGVALPMWQVGKPLLNSAGRSVTGWLSEYGQSVSGARGLAAEQPIGSIIRSMGTGGVSPLYGPGAGRTFVNANWAREWYPQLYAHEGLHAGITNLLARFGVDGLRRREMYRATKFVEESAAFLVQRLHAETWGGPLGEVTSRAGVGLGGAYPRSIAGILYAVGRGKRYMNFGPLRSGVNALFGTVGMVGGGIGISYAGATAVDNTIERMLKVGANGEVAGAFPGTVVPPLLSMTKPEAIERLKDSQFALNVSVGDPAKLNQGEKPRTVASQIPSAGTRWPRSLPVTVVLFGPAESSKELLDVPNVTKKPFDQAEAILIDKGFTAKRISIDKPFGESGREKADQVQSQDPAAGIKATNKTPVELKAYPPYRACVPTVSIDNYKGGEAVDYKTPLLIDVSGKDANGGLTRLKLTARGEPVEGGAFEQVIELPKAVPASDTRVFVIPMSKKDPGEKKKPITITVVAGNQDEKWSVPVVIALHTGGKEYGLKIEHPDGIPLGEGVPVKITGVNCPEGTVLIFVVDGDRDHYHHTETPKIGKDGTATVVVPGSAVEFTTDTLQVTIQDSTVSGTATYQFLGTP